MTALLESRPVGWVAALVRRWLVPLALCSPFVGLAVEAEAGIEISNPEPRCVEVRVGVSGPGGDALSPWLVAHLAGGAPGEPVEVTLPATTVESALLPTEEVVPGSFEPLRWTFEPSSSSLLAASTSGRVARRVEVGPLPVRVEVDVVIEALPGHSLGAGRSREVMGHTFRPVCRPETDEECEAIATTRLEPGTGSVSAPSVARARWAGIEVEGVASLGRARFREAQEACVTRDRA